MQDAIPMDPTTPKLMKKYKEVKAKEYEDEEEKKKGILLSLMLIDLKQIKKEHDNVVKKYVFSEE